MPKTIEYSREAITAAAKQVCEQLPMAVCDQLAQHITANEQLASPVGYLAKASTQLPFDLVRSPNGQDYYLMVDHQFLADERIRHELMFAVRYERSSRTLQADAGGVVVRPLEAKIWPHVPEKPALQQPYSTDKDGIAVYHQLYQVPESFVVSGLNILMQPLPLLGERLTQWASKAYPRQESAAVSQPQQPQAQVTVPQSPAMAWVGSMASAVSRPFASRAADNSAEALSPEALQSTAPKLREALQIAVAMIQTVAEFHQLKLQPSGCNFKVNYMLFAFDLSNFSYDSQHQVAYLRDLEQVKTVTPLSAAEERKPRVYRGYLAPEFILGAGGGQGKCILSSDFYSLAAVIAEVLGCGPALFAVKEQAESQVVTVEPSEATSIPLKKLQALVAADYNFEFPDAYRQLLRCPYTSLSDGTVNGSCADALLALLKGLSACAADGRAAHFARAVTVLQNIQFSVLQQELSRSLRPEDSVELRPVLHGLVLQNNRDRFNQAYYAPLGLAVPDLIGRLLTAQVLSAPVVTSIERNAVLYARVKAVQPITPDVGLPYLGPDRILARFAAQPVQSPAATTPMMVAMSAMTTLPGAATTGNPVTGAEQQVQAVKLRIQQIIVAIDAERQNLLNPAGASYVADRGLSAARWLTGRLGMAQPGVPSAQRQADRTAKATALDTILTKMRAGQQLTETDLQVGERHTGVSGAVKDIMPETFSSWFGTTTGPLIAEYKTLWERLRSYAPQPPQLAGQAVAGAPGTANDGTGLRL